MSVTEFLKSGKNYRDSVEMATTGNRVKHRKERQWGQDLQPCVPSYPHDMQICLAMIFPQRKHQSRFGKDQSKPGEHLRNMELCRMNTQNP